MKKLHVIVFTFLTVAPLLLQGMHQDRKSSLCNDAKKTKKFCNNYCSKLQSDMYKTASDAGATCCIIAPASSIVAGVAVAVYAKNPEPCTDCCANIITSPVTYRCAAFATTACCAIPVAHFLANIDHHFEKQNNAFFTEHQD